MFLVSSSIGVSSSNNLSHTAATRLQHCSYRSPITTTYTRHILLPPPSPYPAATSHLTVSPPRKHHHHILPPPPHILPHHQPCCDTSFCCFSAVVHIRVEIGFVRSIQFHPCCHQTLWIKFRSPIKRKKSKENIFLTTLVFDLGDHFSPLATIATFFWRLHAFWSTSHKFLEKNSRLYLSWVHPRTSGDTPPRLFGKRTGETPSSLPKNQTQNTHRFTLVQAAREDLA
jgi:hypothetical protein